MRIYLDHNATTPVDPEVLEEMLPYLRASFGNPSSIHAYGQEARRGLDLARERVADLIGADPEEIVFTSGGTESINHAIKGVFDAASRPGTQLVISEIEHPAVRTSCSDLKRKGARLTYLSVDKQGEISRAAARDTIGENTRLVSVMLANNEVGTVQPVAEIARIARERGAIVHSDAVQALGKVAFDVNGIQADLISLSSHKIYGPKGVGGLYVRRGTRLNPLLSGGAQESRRRGGTENLPAIVGFGKACALAKERLVADAERIASLREHLEQGLLSCIPDIVIHGRSVHRLPGTSCISFLGVEGETLMMALDIKGIAVSTGAACASVSHDPSHVLTAMGCSTAEGQSAIRFSIGRANTLEEVSQTIEIVADSVARLRGTDEIPPAPFAKGGGQNT
ncbi:MAG: cysteine desulfurase family protein [Myxococcota bacterium]|nr:cysteine desulfurase family protein [Myxococcota bacterium]